MKRMRWIGVLLVLVASASVGGRSARAGVVYVSTLDGYGRPYAFESVDTSTGAVTVISTSTPGLIGLQFVGGQLYGEGYNSGELYRIDPTTGGTTDLGTISPYGAGAGGSCYVGGPSGSTYLFDGDTNSVYTLTPPSPSTTLTNLPVFGGDAGYGGYAFGLDGRIYGLIPAGNNLPETLRILDPTTGQLTAGVALSQNFGDYSRIFFDGSTLDLINQNGLYTINTTTGLVTQDFQFPSNIGSVFAAVEMSSSAVPEPTGLAMLGAGMVVGYRYLRRRRPESVNVHEGM